MGREGDDHVEAAVERVLARADREWRAMRVVAEDRAALRDDLRMELVASAADGVPPSELIGPHVDRFARDLAVSAGARVVPFAYLRLMLAMLVGATPGLVLGWFVILHWWWLPIETSQFNRYVFCAAVFVAGVLAATNRGMRGDPALGRTVTGVAVAVPVTGVVMIPVTMGVASLAGYSTAPHVLLLEAAIVGGALALGSVLARQWAVAPMLHARR